VEGILSNKADEGEMLLRVENSKEVRRIFSNEEGYL